MPASDRFALAANLAQLAISLDCLAHLGVFEQDMVTCLLKEGARKGMLFTRKNMQLEAYCSGIGKVLLAALDEDALEAYLANGPFVPLPANTIVEPEALRAEVVKVRDQDFAIDKREISEDLFCLTLPLTDSTRHVFAAITMSLPNAAIDKRSWNGPLSVLRDGAVCIQARMQDYWR